MLNEQLQKQIEQEADVITARMNDRSDYEAGKIKGFEEGYIKAGERYAEKAQAAEQRMEDLSEKIIDNLDFIAEAKGHISDEDIISQVRIGLTKLLEALSPKTSSDDKVNG